MARVHGFSPPARRLAVLGCAGMLLGLLSGTPGVATAELEGVRDCGDVSSINWIHYQFTADDVLEYKGNQWAVLASEGLKPSCSFARKWAKRGVREADAPANKTYNKRVKNHPPGWKCRAKSAPDPVKSSGGILQCLDYKSVRGKRKLVGAFSAAPDFATQSGPF